MFGLLINLLIVRFATRVCVCTLFGPPERDACNVIDVINIGGAIGIKRGSSFMRDISSDKQRESREDLPKTV